MITFGIEVERRLNESKGDDDDNADVRSDDDDDPHLLRSTCLFASRFRAGTLP